MEKGFFLGEKGNGGLRIPFEVRKLRRCAPCIACRDLIG